MAMRAESVCMAEILYLKLSKNLEKLSRNWLTHMGVWDIIEQREKKETVCNQSPGYRLISINVSINRLMIHRRYNP